MPANAQKPAAPSPASPRNTAKYTNKDGSKFITVPKGSDSSSQPATPTLPATNEHLSPAAHRQPAASAAANHDDDDDDDDDYYEDDASPAAPSVNRKKQKRRQKAAAKAAAENAALNGHAPAAAQGHVHDAHTRAHAPAHAHPHAHDRAHTHSHGHARTPRHAAVIPPPPPPPQHADLVATDDEDDAPYPPQTHHRPSQQNGQPSAASSSKSKKNRKKKKKTPAAPEPDDALSPLPLPPTEPAAARGPGMSRDKIWSTSNHEERERIKEFWLGLGEEERKSLVKVEKDAVLRKMKEQQKHTCSCTVCGRKRNAIEEELEGLYDAYYLELEQFANQGEGPSMLGPPRDFPIRPPRGLPPAAYAAPPHPASRGRIVEHVADDDEDDEEDDEIEEGYSEDEVDDDEYSDDEPPEAFHPSQDDDVADFLTFGNSLQVKGTQLLDTLLRTYGNLDLGGILTVADDLLKNDGKRFIEMMEQLAERRMAREEDAREHFSRGFAHPNGAYAAAPHNHPPPEEEEYEDDEEDEDDYDDSQDEEYDDEEVYSSSSAMPSAYHAEHTLQDQMTEAQRMEEGRRMFQIFAARMFEQRVLSAYKEKVAKERQQKLLEELEEESRQENEQKAKKAKMAQKKKDKAAQRKQAMAEEKARKEAEKAAEDAARIEAEQQRVAQQKQKADEKRRLKEAQRRAEEEARLRKEAERLRKIHEQKERQAEQERKAREAKEREKKAKEEQRVKDREAREQKDREAQERKEKQERDKKDKEARAQRAQREAQEANEAKARAKAASVAAGLVPPQIQLAKRGQQPPPPSSMQQQQQPVPVPVPATAVLPHHPPNPASFASPKVPVATPVLPKSVVPTPARQRAPSQQQQQQQQQHDATFSTASPSLSPRSSTTVHMSPGSIGQERKLSFGTGPGVPYSVSPPGIPSTTSMLSAAFHGSPIGMQPPPGLPHHAAPPGFTSRLPNDPVFPAFRSSPSGMMMAPPGINGPAGRVMPPASGGPIGPPGFQQPVGDQFPISQGYGSMPKDVAPPTHTRQGSGAFDTIGSSAAAMPIGRPAPIGRPGSTSRSGRLHDGSNSSGGGGDDDTDNTKHLGSSVLVEDDEPLRPDILNQGGTLRTQPPGLRPTGFATSPFMDNGFPRGGHNLWAPTPTSANGQHFPPPGFGNPGWGAAAPPHPPPPPGMNPGGGGGGGFTVGSPVIGGGVGMRSGISQTSRHVAIRQMLCAACKTLASSSDPMDDGFVDLGALRNHIENQSSDPTISAQDLLNLCDTEGSASNGGGTFDVIRRGDTASHVAVRWVPDAAASALDTLLSGGGVAGGGHGNGGGGAFRQPVGGEIGSPLMGFSTAASMRGL
ncbi:stress response protein nst1 [Cordyceps javanica]|uniref:Stress response protein NST1 n=1 Tax=Cordyceps javanica TaxID=43265 RepID=A0A545UWD4_9HYPO|nr:stress response protein nst1 [Cordyceps javanica]TQW04559.1 stress response protein nst1 [Cordyceps javanica]